MERGRQCFTSLRSKLLETASSQKSTTLHLRGHPGRSRTLLRPPAGPEGDSRGLRGCQPTTLPAGPADPHGGRRRRGNLKCCFGKAGKCGRAGRITGGPERGREADPYPGLRPAWATPSALPGGPVVMASGLACTWGLRDGGLCSKEGLILNCLPTGRDSQMSLLLTSSPHLRDIQVWKQWWSSGTMMKFLVGRADTARETGCTGR